MTILSNKRPCGYTLIEVVIIAAIIGIITIPVTNFFRSGAKNVVESQNKVVAQEELRQALAAIEPVLMECNEVLQVSSNSITFCTDSCGMPSYQMQGDFDGDGIANIQDPDDDNDAPSALTLPATAQWMVGYDLKDDDDDNDGKIDMRVSFYLS
ncbi:MAG: prepilin-type N-terminal cleavage/methylation domain-containing protein, partial [Endomicrobiales bacterium]